ncbi:hypothetical protein EJ08DRAFT_662870 [Tothia fuscella]|uniref:Uncharacterized protein n=1 Tax=Tothia fuscella TaxID=1048955 RepID=A0A9P4NMX0_9PEZI|nr:hypothetical protein EJ08DRAFT_662870 [Tothia fuscella]
MARITLHYHTTLTGSEFSESVASPYKHLEAAFAKSTLADAIDRFCLRTLIPWQQRNPPMMEAIIYGLKTRLLSISKPSSDSPKMIDVYRLIAFKYVSQHLRKEIKYKCMAVSRAFDEGSCTFLKSHGFDDTRSYQPKVTHRNGFCFGPSLEELIGRLPWLIMCDKSLLEEEVRDASEKLSDEKKKAKKALAQKLKKEYNVHRLPPFSLVLKHWTTGSYCCEGLPKPKHIPQPQSAKSSIS